MILHEKLQRKGSKAKRRLKMWERKDGKTMRSKDDKWTKKEYYVTFWQLASYRTGKRSSADYGICADRGVANTRKDIIIIDLDVVIPTRRKQKKPIPIKLGSSLMKS